MWRDLVERNGVARAFEFGGTARERLARLVHAPATAWGLVAVGAALRLVRFLDGRSLWVDEARLALNVLDRSYAGLLEPLDLNQSAPVGFLLLEKLSVSLLGVSEGALRALPLAAAIAALPLFHALCRRVLSPGAGLLALALFALAEPLVYYASELKPYAGDVFATVGLWWGAARVHENGVRAGGLALLAVFGVAALAISQPAAFVCAGVAIVLFAERWARGTRREMARVAALGGFWALALVLNWSFFLRPASQAAWLQQYWGPAFLPFPPTSWSDLAWYGRTVLGYFEDPVGFPVPGLALAVAAVGALATLRSRPVHLALLAAPVALVAVASAFDQYPIITTPPGDYPLIGRLLLFTVPAGLVLVAAGIERLARSPDPAPRAVAWIAGTLLLGATAITAASKLLDPPRLQEMRDVARFVSTQSRPDDVLLVYHEAVPAFRFYTERLEPARDFALRPIPGRVPWTVFEDRVRELPPAARVWVVFSHHRFWPSASEEQFILKLLDRRGIRLAAIRRPGAAAHLYRLRADTATGQSGDAAAPGST